MSEEQLLRALKPVYKYFSGRELSVNSVLAAYLRSSGLPVSGQTWETAKQAMSRGAGFNEAVMLAASQSKTQIKPTPVAANQLPTPFTGHSLGWFPKQFGPGDIDGVGAKRLLGTPKSDSVSVLVREMGQNSWDARRKSPSIDFVLNLRLLRGPVMETLRKRIFTGDPPKTGLAELLRHDQIWALEVSDRGTIGLCGPIRNDLAVDPGMDTDFIDLVFNIGAPRDMYLGGGTYGFGKTISYIVSGVGTVLIWSRCEGSSGLEHRLIGSAIGDGFNMNGQRFTGRHWWGNAIPSQARVEPAVGDLAEELGDAVFANQFDRRVTGTSILILDPQLGGDSPEKTVEQLAAAVVWNLWPKLLAEQRGQTRMNIGVQLNGTPITLPSIEHHSVLSGRAHCLLAVRAAQFGSDLAALSTKYPVYVEEIWLKKPKKLLGHLALARYPVPPGTESPSHAVTVMRQAELVVRNFERQELDVEGFQWTGVFKPVADVDDSFALAEPPSHDDWVPQAVQDKSRRTEVRVALARIREATDQYLTPRKPTVASSEASPSAAHVGDMLADLLGGLEGPAPSNWMHPPAAGSSASAGTTASVATSNGDASATTVPPPSPGTESVGAAGSASSLAGNTRTLPGVGMGRRVGRPRIIVADVSHEPAQSPGWTRTTLNVQLASGSSAASAVDVSLRVGFDGGSMEDAGAIRIFGWSDASGDNFASGSTELQPDIVRQFVFEARSDLAIDVETKLGDR
ncbi:MAG TPA: hypothetical protein VFQ44_16380 [Streptosporangiaceae bacterium]|nr:hypothetical protein [Streptosporangiaceae bacterium]